MTIAADAPKARDAHPVYDMEGMVHSAAVPMEDSRLSAFPKAQTKFVLGNVLLAMFALLLGGLPGIGQALERVGINLYNNDVVTAVLDEQAAYYQGLTLHGVLLVIVYTFTFANGFTARVIEPTSFGAMRRTSGSSDASIRSTKSCAN